MKNLVVLEGGRNIKVIIWDMEPDFEKEAQQDRQ